MADGIMAAHQTIEGWTRDELIAALRYWRNNREDIDFVWMVGRWDNRSGRMTGMWANEVDKAKLAEALWPALERKIEQLSAGISIPIPPIVQIIRDAYGQAEHRRHVSFTLTETLVSPDETA